ncbi:unnamed protein product [Cladocopium goreaui]|uniref:PUB domain-containing protein n=1 Tax=Cladocopium goreaui TaxID=2562237 RepID=A0A9P1BK35_9DINO|nr:unnamed protein product [Cladocopium goreaui]
MAAFSDVGAICSEASCRRQVRAAVKRIFCPPPASPASDYFAVALANGILEALPGTSQIYSAGRPGCKEQISAHNALQCQRCGQMVCVHHRFEDQHPCVDLEAAVKEALKVARKSLRQEEFAEAVRTLGKVFGNILSQPKNEKYRSLRKDNAVVKEKLKHPSCIASLQLCGFFDDGDFFVCPDSRDLTTMRRVCGLLKEVPLTEGVRIVDGVIMRPPKVEAKETTSSSTNRGYVATPSRPPPVAGSNARPKSAFDFQRRERDTQQAQADDLQELRRQQKEQQKGLQCASREILDVASSNRLEAPLSCKIL